MRIFVCCHMEPCLISVDTRRVIRFLSLFLIYHGLMCDDCNEAKKPECVFIEYDHSCISAVRGVFETWSPLADSMQRRIASRSLVLVSNVIVETLVSFFRVVMEGCGHKAAIVLEVRSRLPSLL